ncbi:follistatin-like [Hydractinia symbiolongicarpus]|uniref:follistatin-like n=1 Tax=Hydractinia symbiolongicarpus TaxID=13093 RepID=UPI00254EE8C6|nr:follistatin-like [Hydractinia symbiolongicarpus]
MRCFLILVVICSQNIGTVAAKKGFLCWTAKKQDSCRRVLGYFDNSPSCCKSGGTATTEYESAALAFKYRYGLIKAPCVTCPGATKGACKETICSESGNNCKYSRLCAKVTGKVCGTDGVTYADGCEMSKILCASNINNVDIAYNGNCKDFCKGVTCSDGKSCVYDQSGASYCITRTCPSSCIPGQQLCAADGKTYESHCHLLKAACDSHQVIAVAHHGPCTTKERCDGIICKVGHKCVTNSKGKPQCINCCEKNVSVALFEICGSNGKVYYDWCDLKRESCKTGKIIHVDFSGKKCKT